MTAEVNDYAGTKSQYVLVIVLLVVEERDEIVGFDQAQGKMAFRTPFQFQSAAYI